ncbi:hypothetical protein ASE61_11515 [Bosea sp. Root670]|uniref:hypothetical protein n=1 Tax=Bosea sp. Root670 TaxID=1736583 RepID=UPI00071487B8|nr:hypothetical protein [Bosea sp. Root670]KRE03126.1 hypothetical protein ASE61_11515 [Bosea sp. Root670]
MAARAERAEQGRQSQGRRRPGAGLAALTLNFTQLIAVLTVSSLSLARDLATMLLRIGLTLALSWLVHRLVERPMIRLGRPLSSRSDAPAGYSIALKRFR